MRATGLFIFGVLFLGACASARCWRAPLTPTQVEMIREFQCDIALNGLRGQAFPGDREAARYVGSCFPLDPVSGDLLFGTSTLGPFSPYSSTVAACRARK